MALRTKNRGSTRPYISSPPAGFKKKNETILLELNKESGGRKHEEFIENVLFEIK